MARLAGIVALAAAGVCVLACQGALAAGPPTRVTGDFSLTATASASTVPVGGAVTVSVALVSTGNSDLATPTLATSYPGQVVELSSATAATGACTPEIKCTLATVPVGQRGDATIAFKALAPGTVTLDLTATARYLIYADGALGASASVTKKTSVTFAVVQRSADVQIKLTTASKPTVGKVLKAAAVVLNRGADDAPGASLDFRVPAGFKLVALASAQGSCSVALRHCTFPTLAPAGSARVMLSLLPSRPVAGTIVGTARTGAAVDPAGANNVAKLVLMAKAPVVKAHRSG